MKLNKKIVTILVVLITLVFGGVVATATGLITWGGERDIKSIEKVITQLDSKLISKENAMTDSTNALKKLNGKLNEAENKLTAAKNDLARTQALNNQKDDIISQKEWEIQVKLGELVEKDQQIQAAIVDGNNKVNEKNKEVDRIRQELEAKKADNERLKNELLALQNEKAAFEDKQYESNAKLDKALQDVKQLKAYAEEVNQRHSN